MAIEERTARTVFKGDGSTRAFPVTWYLDAEENVIVKMTNVTTAQVKTLELGTDYTVTPSDDEYPTNGAVINYPKNSVTPALGSDYRLTVIRNVPYTQNFVFPNNTRLLPKNIEGGLDGLELQIQQINDKADNAVNIPAGMDYNNDEFVAELFDKAKLAEQSAINAKASETNAKASENSAKNSASSASQSAQTATTKANEASSSATKAKTSETNAKTSETNAKTSENSAKNSATSASQSAQTATTKASEASSSATSASQSAETATTKANEASSSAASAEESEAKALEYAERAENASGSVNNPVSDVTVKDNIVTVTKGGVGSVDYTVDNVDNANHATTADSANSSVSTAVFNLSYVGTRGASGLSFSTEDSSNIMELLRISPSQENKAVLRIRSTGDYIQFLNCNNATQQNQLICNFPTSPTAPTPGTNINNTQIATTKFVHDVIDEALVGTVIYSPVLKSGFVKLNGATVNRSDYPRLVTFATKNGLFTSNNSSTPYLFGTGNGSTTFVLPGYRNVFIEGGDTPAKIEAGLPNINGEFFAVGWEAEGTETSGAFYTTKRWQNVMAPAGSTIGGRVFNLDASKSDAIYGKSTTVQPPAIVLIPQIKY